MKKIIVVAAFLCIALTQLSAQFEDVRFGFQLSPAFTSMGTDNNQINRNGTNLGLKSGILTELYFRQNYAFSTGIGFAFNHGGSLTYEYKGKYWTESDLGSVPDTLPAGVKLKYSLQFIEIPLLIKMRTREFGRIRYFLEPGVFLNFKSKSQGSIEGRGIGSDAEKINIKKEVNGIGLLWGMNGGLEYSLAETTSLVAGLGFQSGFTDLTKDKGTIIDPSKGPVRDRSKATGNAIVLKIGVIF
jgi:hypothetical protein